MLFNILKRSFLNQKRAMAVMIVSVAVGTAIAASLLALSFDISSKVSRELRSFGANIVVQPRITGLAGVSGQKRYLREADIPKAKTIFWRHNILGVAPLLVVRDEKQNAQVLGTWYLRTIALPGEKKGFDTGASTVMPWWSIEGKWPAGDSEILAGIGIAEKKNLKIGDRVAVGGRQLRISGVLNAGGREDDMFVGELATVQLLYGLPGRISQVAVSALTTPMDDFAYKDPATMSRKEYEKWYCTGYVTSIAKQLEEVFAGSVARPIWPVAEAEGNVLSRLELLIILLTAVSLLAAALGISTTMIMSLLKRTEEVALMKGLGANTLQTVTVFLSEALLIGLAGGAVGYLLSLGISSYLGYQVFGTALEQKGMLLPISIGVSEVISVLGAYLPIRRALRIKPAIVLKGGQ
ncbi:MAG: ABC transporter permease [Nitrospirota bacterium]|nr:ABC transporter permease [Nitrospirota bacterium]